MRLASLLAPCLASLLALCWPSAGIAAESLFAAVCQSTDAIRLALESGAPADDRNDQGETALHALYRCGTGADDPAFHDATRELIDAGVDLSLTDNQGRSAVHAALESIAGHKSAVNLYVDGARLMLARSANPALADNQGITPLHLAAAEPAAQVSQLLLDLGVDSNVADAQGYRPLWYALTADDNFDTFALLLNQLSDEALAQTGAELGALAAQQKHYSKVDLLLQRLPTLQLPSDALTETLTLALWQGAPVPLLNRLVAAGAQADSLQQNQPQDLAWRLASLDRTAELQWLLEHGWQINAPPFSGYPSLYFADAPTTARLLSAGASANPEQPQYSGGNYYGGTLLTPTDDAPPEYGEIEAWRSRERSEHLLRAGYQPSQDTLGRSDLALAIGADDLWLVQQLLTRTPTPNVGNEESNSDDPASLITLALQHGRLPLVQTILRAITPSTVRATFAAHPEIISQYTLTEAPDPVLYETLLIAGADANTLNDSGSPVLHLAARQQRWAIVELLLNHGADPQQHNAQGCTLRCYEWSMPESLQARLHQPKTFTWQAPEISHNGAAFFAVAMVPTLILWLLTVAWRLATRRSLVGPTLWMLAALVSAILAGAALFYRCEPCVLKTPLLQLALTALIATCGYLLCVIQAYFAQLRAAANKHSSL
jgi:ankyrin repeat protein